MPTSSCDCIKLVRKHLWGAGSQQPSRYVPALSQTRNTMPLSHLFIFRPTMEAFPLLVKCRAQQIIPFGNPKPWFIRNGTVWALSLVKARLSPSVVPSAISTYGLLLQVAMILLSHRTWLSMAALTVCLIHAYLVWLKFCFIDQSDRRADAAIALKLKLILIETPSNPLVRGLILQKLAASEKKWVPWLLSTTSFWRL